MRAVSAQNGRSGTERTVMPADRDWRQIGGSARGYQGVGGPLSSPGTAY
jgi:hypothetical protein